MEKIKTVKFDLVRTLLFIKDNTVLTRVLNKRYNTKFEDIFQAIKEGRFKPDAIEYIKGIFEGIIAADSNMVKIYNGIKIPNDLIIDSIDIPQTLTSAISPVEEEIEIGSIEDLIDLRNSLSQKELINKIKSIQGIKTNPIKLPKAPKGASGIIINSKRPSAPEIQAKAIRQNYYTTNDRLMLKNLQLNNLYCNIQARAAKQKFTDEEARLIKSAIETLENVVSPIMKKKK